MVYTTVQRGGHEHEDIAAMWKTGEVKFLKGTGSVRVQHEDGSDAFIHYTRVLAVVDSHQPDERGYDPDADEWLFPPIMMAMHRGEPIQTFARSLKRAERREACKFGALVESSVIHNLFV